MMSFDETSRTAIKRAIKALRKRHLLEEGAHAPAVVALTRPFAAQGSEWKEKADKLELELQQCYRAQSRLSEQLVVEVAECRSSKAVLQEKESLIDSLQNETTQIRGENSKLRESLNEKTGALDLAVTENQALKAQLADVMQKLKEAQVENKNLIDRWMLEKMKDAEKLNEVNALYEEMMAQARAGSIEDLARQQVDGVVRQREEDDDSAEAAVPSSCKRVLHAHDGGCGSLSFEHHSGGGRLITGGHDRTVKIWDVGTGALLGTLTGSLGSVLDVAVTQDDRFVIGASSSHDLCVWESSSGRIRHALTGHVEKVCGVDAAGRSAVSAAYDHTIKIWDLQRGYCAHTIATASNCNAVACNQDGLTIWSGHVDGNLRLWDGRTGRMTGEVAAHSQAVTSVRVSRGGTLVLTSGRDNAHNLFDARTLELCATFSSNSNNARGVASNWSRSCISGDDRWVAAGSADGSLSIWSRFEPGRALLLRGHNSPVLSCVWSGLTGGGPLASAHRNGTVCIWGA